MVSFPEKLCMSDYLEPPGRVAREQPLEYHNIQQTYQQHHHQQQHSQTTEPNLESQQTSPSSVHIPVSSLSPVYSQQSSLSCCSSKGAFRELTRDILNLTVEPTNKPEVQVTSLDPAKFDPMNSMEVPFVYDSHSSYSSATDSNRSMGHQTMYQGHPELQVTRAPSPPKAYSYPTDASQYPKRLPQSKSEGNVKSFDYSGYGDSALPAAHYHDWEAISKLHAEQQQWQKSEHGPSGGRGRGRSRSPVKVLEDLDEESPIEFMSSPKRSRSPHKKLFGENGWLGRSPNLKDSPGDKHKKPGFKSLGEKIKQRVEDMTGDVMKGTPNAFQPRMLMKSTFPISLDPPTQAKLYSEMELMICVSANQFLIEQYREGRMSVDSVNKVTNFWVSKNRPQVVQFQFDQATQRDLILYNLRSFEFHGECAVNTVVLNATLYNWKAMAKEMSVRTFCHPDSVIRKHMYDTHKLLEMLGAPLVTFLAFQELQMNALSLIKKAQEKMLPSSEQCAPNEYEPAHHSRYENGN